MGVGDFLGERSEARFKFKKTGEPMPRDLWKTGIVTFASFLAAGFLPLVPYVIQLVGISIEVRHQLFASIISTAFALFLVGSLRTWFTGGRWWQNGLEVLGIGAVAATVAYTVGAYVDRLTS